MASWLRPRIPRLSARRHPTPTRTPAWSSWRARAPGCHALSPACAQPAPSRGEVALSAICQHARLARLCTAPCSLGSPCRLSCSDAMQHVVGKSSVRGPHSLHTAEATGSKPVTPTSTNSLLDLALSGACQKICQKTTLSRQRSALSTVQIEGSRRVRADHLLATPDRPAWSPATARNGAVEVAVALSVIVRWGTGPDRCEWHASGTTGGADVRGPGCVSTSSPQGAARPGDACLVGKSRRPAAAVSWDFEPAAA